MDPHDCISFPVHGEINAPRLPISWRPENLSANHGDIFNVSRRSEASRGRNFDLVDRQPARQALMLPFSKAPLGPKGNIDRLFPISRQGAAVVALLGDVDDPDIDLWLDPSGAGSNTAALGDPYRTRIFKSERTTRRHRRDPVRARIIIRVSVEPVFGEEDSSLLDVRVIHVNPAIVGYDPEEWLLFHSSLRRYGHKN
jgi:hypothetical protein